MGVMGLNMKISLHAKKNLKLLILLAITLFIYSQLFKIVGFHNILRVLSGADPEYLALSLLPFSLSILLTAKRWQNILLAMGYPINYIRCFNVLMAAFPLTSITPSKSGDLIRAYYLKSEIPITKVMGSVLTERLFDMSILVCFSLIGMAFFERYEFASAVFCIFILITLAILVLYRGVNLPLKKSWNTKIQNIALSLRLLIKNKSLLFSVASYSAVIWGLAVVQTVMLFYALNIHVPLIFVAGNIPIAIFVGLIPVSLGGMGTRDAAIIFLFSDYASASQLLGVGILFSLFRYWLLSLSGIPFMKKMLK